jgi:polygalacturonase
MDGKARRDFLRLSSVGIAGSSLGVATGQGQLTPVEVRAGFYNVRTFGARGDGASVDSDAINRAIEAAAAAGGGSVLVPAGTYLCYSIRLKSNLSLYLDAGVTIVAADPPSSGTGGYDTAEPDNGWSAYQDFGHNHWHNSLIWGEGIANVSISGPGLIWGRGLSKGYGSGPPAEKRGVGNKTVSLKNCHNVTLRDFSILKGGHFGILATAVDNLTICNLRIDTDRDGIDIDGCRNVRISDCSVNSPWDDAICLKSSFALGYPRATESITISNCYVTGTYKLGTMLDGTFQHFAPGDEAYRTGRIKCGTESNGGFRNIAISNCVFQGCQGLALETVDGALLEDVTVSNITMRDVAVPFFLRLGSRMRGPAGAAIGELRRVLISNIVCSDCDPAICSIISGIPGHAIEDITFHDIYIQHRGGGTIADGAIQPPEEERKYPEPSMFGHMPSQGFLIRHAKNVLMSNVEISASREDYRPAFVLQDVQGADFFRVRTTYTENVPTFVLNDVNDFGVHLSKHVPDSNFEHIEHNRL